MFRILLIGTALLFSACSGGDGTTADQTETARDGNHVWKTQTDQIDRARDVENVLQQAHEKQLQDIDEQAR
jgi:hypothetical protein